MQQERFLLARSYWSIKAGRYVSHIDLARGEPIAFGGEIRFSDHRQRGQILRWNDQTGHYHDPGRPMNPAIVQCLPGELFVPKGATP